jgi:esterase FrsA
MRIFSLTIPGHEPPLEPQNAIAVWAEDFTRGNDPLTPFIDKIAYAAEHLQSSGIASQVGIAGLSRGGFLATHAAAKTPVLQTVLGYAPLTCLGLSKEFSSLSEDTRIPSFDLVNLYDKLINKNIRFYIGNRDVRVSTSACFAFVQGLAETAFQNRIRSPQVELIISPSIGHQGHGTSKPIFEQGAAWIAQQLGAAHV